MEQMRGSPPTVKSNVDIFIYNKTKRPPKISFGSASCITLYVEVFTARP